MSNRRKPLGKPTDPRLPGGDISGPGGPFDRDAVVLDTANAVLMDLVTVTMVETSSDGELGQAYAMMLEGRINQTRERTRILYLFGPDGAAAIVSELLDLAGRAGPEFVVDLYRRLEELKTLHTSEE
jgi:hypothetical protein